MFDMVTRGSTFSIKSPVLSKKYKKNIIPEIREQRPPTVDVNLYLPWKVKEMFPPYMSMLSSRFLQPLLENTNV